MTGIWFPAILIQQEKTVLFLQPSAAGLTA
jgi:hypothetical protein